MGVIALLNDPQAEVCAHAVNTLLQLVDYFWYEVSDAIPRLSLLAQQLPQPEPVWLLLAKLHFHLGDHEESVRCALKAGALFSISERSPFVESTVAKAIDLYVALRRRDEAAEPVLVQLVERLAQECLAAREFRQAIGIAIECHRLDILEGALRASGETQQRHLLYAQQIAIKHVTTREYQCELLTLIANLAKDVASPDLIFIGDCLVAMQDAEGCARLLVHLLEQCRQDEAASALRPVAVQLCFNICADATRDFLNVVLRAVRQHSKAAGEGGDPLGEQLLSVLDGSRSTRLHLEFLYRNNVADMLILERTKDSLHPQSSMHHSALSCANALMHCGSTNDEFLRKNLDWLGHASNWAKFTAASSLGVIHKGQVEKGPEVLKPYLPTNDGSASPYSEGGAMFALGLIRARTGAEGASYFIDQLAKTDNEVLQHGICLGLGALAMSSDDPGLVEKVRGVLYGDNAVSGEAAAVAIGLILHASGNVEAAQEILAYARDSQHEKLIRGITLGIALIFAGQRDGADVLIEQMLQDKEPVLRAGALWTLASAYAGTSDNRALGRLLHTAVSDVNDDVRRVAVTALGFVLCQNPAELPRIIELLTESYNPHVRYGAAMALGIAFAGTGSKEAIELIKPMCKDFTDYVRQGAYIGLAMVLMQQNSATCDETNWARACLESVATAKLEDAMAKYGAVLAQGIIDAGGRNSVVSLTSASGHVNHMAVAGVMLFCQFWYWYPMSHFLSFALAPTALIAVDPELRVPKLQVTCHAKPSRFAPPPPLKAATVAAPKKLVTAILSTTAKAAARARKAAGRTTGDMEVDNAPTVKQPLPTEMEVEVTPPPVTETTKRPDASPAEQPQKTSGDDLSTSAAGGPEEASPAARASPEPEAFSIGNLSRVTLLQQPLITFPADGKYALPSGRWRGEIVVLTDRDPSVPAEYFELSEIKIDNSSVAMAADKANAQPTEKADNKDASEEVSPPPPFEAEL